MSHYFELVDIVTKNGGKIVDCYKADSVCVSVQHSVVLKGMSGKQELEELLEMKKVGVENVN